MDDDGEIQGIRLQERTEELEKAIRRIGSECIDYRNSIHAARKMLEGAAIAGVAILGPTAPAIFSNNPNLCMGNLMLISSVPALAGFARWMKGQEGMPRDFRESDLFGFKQTKRIKNEIETNLLALKLPKEYVRKNFDRIVLELANKERGAREEDELNETRKRLGITDEQVTQTLDELLEKQNVSSTIK